MSPLSPEVTAPSAPPATALAEAREHLWRHGWALLLDVMPTDLLDALSHEADRLVAEVPAGVHRSAATDLTGGVLVMNGLDARSDLLYDVARTPAMTSIADAMLGKASIPIHTEYFGKPQAGAAPTPPHQDQVFYQHHFDDEPAVTFWTPLQDVLPGAGALEYGSPCPAPGSLLPHHGSDSPDFGAQLVDAALYTFTPVAAPRRSCLVHHAYVVHRSGPMTSEVPRRVFAFNYRGSSYREARRRTCPRS